MALLTHVASHPDALVSLLCDQLAVPPDDLFAPEIVAVPTRGIERWITQRIASDLAARGVGDGIAANIEFPSPRRLVRRVLLEVPALAASADAWEGPLLTGHLVDAIDAHLDEAWMRILARFLESPYGTGDLIGPDRLSAARKISRLFATYARRRPAMIRAWAAGENVGSDGTALADDDVWQPNLWRIIHERIGIPSLAELLPGALDPIRTGAIDPDLPGRIAVYGLTATDPLDLEVLQALSERRDVHLYVLHPSPGLWNLTAESLAAQPHPSRPPDRDRATDMANHPLLKSWARDSSELQLVLAGHGITGSHVGAQDAAAGTMLARLQGDIRRNVEPHFASSLTEAVENGDDRSIQIHVCHGARRQAEVLRDAILHTLAADPTLEARDVVIMTPDLATFAPLLEAAFPSDQAASPDGIPDLRLRIADRSPSATNPLVRFAATVLDIADSRLEAGAVRELVTRPVVQQRFGFDADMAGEIISIIDDTRIAWGVDQTDRQRWNAGTNDERTWRRGLDRGLTGVFYPDSATRIVGDTVPLDGVEGQDAAPVGLLAQIMDRIEAVRALLGRQTAMSKWSAAIATSVRLLAAPAWGDEWQRDQLERLLEETFTTGEPDAVAGAVPEPDISLPEARLAITSWVEDRPSPLHFRTGDVTVCTLAPMRSVPYRVVALLGLDDDRFPRSSRADGDDLLIGHEIVGDHDRDAQDRQLLLDAVMAAGDQLIVTYSGRDELTNAEYPPAVPIAELEDTLRDTIGASALEKIVTVHPLQSFSADNFTSAALGVPGPWGFDPMQLEGALAMEGRAMDAGSAPLQWPAYDESEPIPLGALVGFLQHPARRFIRTRLGFSIPALGEVPDDTLPVDIDALAKWSITNRILTGLTEGYELDAVAARERATDALPPGDLGRGVLEAASETAAVLLAAAVVRGYDPRRHRGLTGSVTVGGSVVEGSVTADPTEGLLALVTPSRLKGKQRLKAFAELLFLSVLDPEISWKALLLGKRERGDGLLAVTIGPVGDSPTARRREANLALTDLADLYNEGMQAPLPMPCETCYAWQRALGKGRAGAFNAARSKWETDRFSPEAADDAYRLLFPELMSTDKLVDAGLADYSARLWGPILPLMGETQI